MKRVLVLGNSGSGKSTFAKNLAGILDIPWINLDSHYWKPNWIETPKDEWEAIVTRLIEQEKWVMDGNYSSTLEMRLERSDTVIFLDVPRRISFWRVFKRRVIHHGRVRSELAEGCTEKIDLDFLRWIWGYPNRTEPRIERILTEYNDRITLHILKNSREIEDFLYRVKMKSS